MGVDQHESGVDGQKAQVIQVSGPGEGRCGGGRGQPPVLGFPPALLLELPCLSWTHGHQPPLLMSVPMPLPPCSPSSGGNAKART